MSRLERQRRRRRHGGSPLKRALLLGAILLACGMALAALAAVGWVISVANSAPNISQLQPRNPGQVSEVSTRPASARIPPRRCFARTTGTQIPKQLKQATVAIEDRRFCQHGGVDYQGIVRAGDQGRLRRRRELQGGSTLTMQLVNNIYLPAALRSEPQPEVQDHPGQARRTAREVQHPRTGSSTSTSTTSPTAPSSGQTRVRRRRRRRRCSSTSRSAKLDLAQIALLAGLPQAPTDYNPFLDPGDARARRSEVLAAMVSSRLHHPGAGDAAKRSGSRSRRTRTTPSVRQPYVFDYVAAAADQEARPEAPSTSGGLKVYTTINLA